MGFEVLIIQRPPLLHLPSDAPPQSVRQDPISHHYRLDIHRLRICRRTIHYRPDIEESG